METEEPKPLTRTQMLSLRLFLLVFTITLAITALNAGTLDPDRGSEAYGLYLMFAAFVCGFFATWPRLRGVAGYATAFVIWTFLVTGSIDAIIDPDPGQSRRGPDTPEGVRVFAVFMLAVCVLPVAGWTLRFFTDRRGQSVSDESAG